MKLRTPWIVTGSLAALAAAGGFGAALAGPPADRELTTGVVSQLPSPAVVPGAPATDVASAGTSALTPVTASPTVAASPAAPSVASPVAVSALSPVVVSAASPAPAPVRAPAPAPVSAGSPVSADSGD